MIAEAKSRTDPRQAFQQLKLRIHRRLVDAIDLPKMDAMDKGEFRKQLQALAVHLCRTDSVQLDRGKQSTMVREIMDEIEGFGPLTPLLVDPEISDVFVNDPANVFVVRHGSLEKSEIRFADENHFRQLLNRLVSLSGKRFDQTVPIVDTKLPNGWKLHAVFPPISPSGLTLSLHRLANRLFTLEELVEMGTLADDMARFLTNAVRQRANILISGSHHAGKTTLLASLSRAIPQTERVITVEQSAELNLQLPDVVSMESQPGDINGHGEIDAGTLLKNALKMRPDRIIVGDVLGSEVLEMLRAMNGGHSGIMCTIRANEKDDALARLETMIALSGVKISPSLARKQISSALQILVHVDCLDRSEYRVTHISELHGCKDDGFNIEDIFVHRMTGVDSSNRVRGLFYATGYQPRCIQSFDVAGTEIPETFFYPRELSKNARHGVPGNC